MEIIRERERIEEVSYSKRYIKNDASGCSYSFPCSKEGELMKSAMSEAAWNNYLACASGGNGFIDAGVAASTHTYSVPAVGRCRCGNEVHLDSGWSNLCERCGREYNGSGQELAPRSQWGEETGERF